MLDPSQSAVSPLRGLLDLARDARRAESALALQFILVNQTHALLPYLVGVMWIRGEGVVSQSGVSQLDRNAPFILWLSGVCESLDAQKKAVVVTPDMLNEQEVAEWSHAFPKHALWLPIAPESDRAAGLLLGRELAWTAQDITLLSEWVDTWAHSWKKLDTPSVGGGLRHTLKGAQAAWNRKRWRWLLLAVVVIVFPVRLSVLVPGELVPANPAIIRVPIEGVVDEIYVKPNQRVVAGQPLFKLDLTTLSSRLQVAQQETQIATTEYRQSALQSLTDPKSRGQLLPQAGKAAERRLEADYVRELIEKVQIKSPRSGIVLFDDPSAWIGRPVAAGEKVMVVATEGDVEIEAWIPMGDAIELADRASVTLYLNASPLSPVRGEVRYEGHEALQRPDGSFAYRLRASLPAGERGARIGLKGTAKMSGEFVPLAYWVLRKPFALLRQVIGL